MYTWGVCRHSRYIKTNSIETESKKRQRESGGKEYVRRYGEHVAESSKGTFRQREYVDIKSI